MKVFPYWAVKSGHGSVACQAWNAQQAVIFEVTIRYRIDRRASTGLALTIRRRMGREEWLRAARLALIRLGEDGVRVERLARDLKLTKGSFYWHFKDRDELLEALLREWEEESEMLFQEMTSRGVGDAVAFLRDYLRQAVSSPSGVYPPDVGVYNWPRPARGSRRASTGSSGCESMRWRGCPGGPIARSWRI